jgi:hypothetical protein
MNSSFYDPHFQSNPRMMEHSEFCSRRFAARMERWHGLLPVTFRPEGTLHYGTVVLWMILRS